MVNVVFVSLYLRTDEYPQKYTLSSMRLASYIMSREDVNVRIIPSKYDMTDCEIEELAETLDGMNINILGLSAYVWTWDVIKKINSAITHRNDLCVMVGGPELKSRPLDDWEGKPIFVYGDAELFLDELCPLMSEKRDVRDIHTRDIISDAVKKNGVYYTPLDRKIAWRNALYSEEFFKKLKLNEFSNEFVWIDMSRGCTYQCGYCGFRNRKGVAILQKDAIHEEIINLGKMDAKRVFIVDANLGGIPAIGKFIFSEFAKYAPNVKIIGYLRPEFLDDEYLAILEKSNIEELRFGIQTINENVPRWIRNNDITAVKTMLPKLKDVGVFWRAELMVGLPGDDFKALKESFRFVIDEIQPSLLFAYRLTVLHGTEVEQLCNSNVSEWVKADESSGGKVLASFSYSEKELMEMLDFSNKITNLYNKAKVIKPTYEELLDCMKNKVNSES